MSVAEMHQEFKVFAVDYHRQRAQVFVEQKNKNAATSTRQILKNQQTTTH